MVARMARWWMDIATRYNRAGDRTSRGNELNSGYSESYSYDGLSRLVDTNRNGTDLQDWDLDALGNWSGFTDGAATQTRESNEANEITGISGTLGRSNLRCGREHDQRAEGRGRKPPGCTLSMMPGIVWWLVMADNNGEPGSDHRDLYLRWPRLPRAEEHRRRRYL